METQKGPTLQESGNRKSYFEHMYFFFSQMELYIMFCFVYYSFTDVIIFFMLIIDIDHNFYAT